MSGYRVVLPLALPPLKAEGIAASQLLRVIAPLATRKPHLT